MTNLKNIKLMAYGMYLNISQISAYCAKDVSCFFLMDKLFFQTQ